MCVCVCVTYGPTLSKDVKYHMLTHSKNYLSTTLTLKRLRFDCLTLEIPRKCFFNQSLHAPIMLPRKEWQNLDNRIMFINSSIKSLYST